MLEVGNIIAHMDVQFLHIIPATDEISQRPELYYPSPKVPSSYTSNNKRKLICLNNMFYKRNIKFQHVFRF